VTPNASLQAEHPREGTRPGRLVGWYKVRKIHFRQPGAGGLPSSVRSAQTSGRVGDSFVKFAVLALSLSLVSACASLPEKKMLTVSDFAHLRFLEGRWIGKAPDGSDFYEEYSFPNEREMRSSRYPNASFNASNDGSVVAWQDGQVTST
jgi:hypothetical protein